MCSRRFLGDLKRTRVISKFYPSCSMDFVIFLPPRAHLSVGWKKVSIFPQELNVIIVIEVSNDDDDDDDS